MADPVTGLLEVGTVPKSIGHRDRSHETDVVVEAHVDSHVRHGIGLGALWRIFVPDFHGLELIAGWRRAAKIIGRVDIHRMHDQDIAEIVIDGPETDTVAGRVVRSVDILMFLIDVYPPRIVAEIVVPPGLARRVDELARIGLKEPTG